MYELKTARHQAFCADSEPMLGGHVDSLRVLAHFPELYHDLVPTLQQRLRRHDRHQTCLS